MVLQAKSGHIGGSLGMADVASVLWYDFLNISTKFIDHPNRDRFILSCGHLSPLLYSLLHAFGFLSYQDCMNFRKLGSKTPGHPERNPVTGIEVTTGPLGQGIGYGVGMARARALKDLDYFTYVFCSDGDLMEGVGYEAIALATEWQLDKLILFWDDNAITIDGKLQERSRSFIWNLFSDWCRFEVDAHNYDQIHAAILAAQANGPAIIRCRSIIGKGLASEGSHKCHGVPPAGELEELIKRLNVESLSSNLWEPAIIRANRALEARSMPAPEKSPPMPVVQETKLSTRKLAGKMLSHFQTGSADLGESTCMISARDYTNFGVREHAMVSIGCGMNLAGSNIVIATFLVFTDYCRASIRLAAMMKINITIICTHDSVLVGEDGPTHQPVEHINSLRLIPNLHVWRPASYNEMKAALQDVAPKVIVCTRQEIELLPYNLHNLALCKKGGYLVKDHPNTNITIIATGSEVQLALDVSEKLLLNARVVSIPCLEVFQLQPQVYQDSLLDGVVVVIEAGNKEVWYRYAHVVIGVEEFGYSCPGEESPRFNRDSVIAQINTSIKEFLCANDTMHQY
jgi:transketolase